jgi:hypothetical protein
MARVEDVMLVDASVQTLRQTFNSETQFLQRLRQHPNAVSDADFAQAIANLHNCFADLVTLVLNIYRAAGIQQNVDQTVARTFQRLAAGR